MMAYVVCRAKQAAYPEDYVAECSLDERGDTRAVTWLFIFLTLLLAMSVVPIWGAMQEKIRRSQWFGFGKNEEATTGRYR